MATLEAPHLPRPSLHTSRTWSRHNVSPRPSLPVLLAAVRQHLREALCPRREARRSAGLHS
jgi:hypothetical protein